MGSNHFHYYIIMIFNNYASIIFYNLIVIDLWYYHYKIRINKIFQLHTDILKTNFNTYSNNFKIVGSGFITDKVY